MLNADGDHDYAGIRLARSSSEDDHFVFLRRSARGRQRRVVQRLENSDHDYVGAAAAHIESSGLEEWEEADVEPPERTEPEADAVATLQQENPVDIVDAVNGGANDPPDPGPYSDANEAGTSTAAAAVVELINLTTNTPSPPKKRKRLSLAAQKSGTPKLKSISSNGDADEDDDDGLTCPICLDTWEMSGEHRLVSLRCGHLFGDACIRRWLNESARQSGIKACPQCKTKATQKDIRFLYAKRLRAIDRSEEHELRQLLDVEKLRTQTLQTEMATMKMSSALLTNQIQALRADNDRMKQILRTGGAGKLSYASDAACGDPKLLQRLQSYKLFMERNIEISRDPGCRVMIYSEQQSAIIVSQKSSQSLFPGYGLRFIDTPTFRASNFLHTSAKLLRDISLNADQQLLAVASMETRAKLFDLRTRQVASVFTPGEKALWACAMDRNEREHFLYLGAQHGSTYVYDVRFPETVVDEFRTEGDCSPVINVAPVPANKIFPSGGFLVCKLQSLWFYEYSSASGTATPTRLNIEGPFISMNFDSAHETILVSARNSTRFPQSRYILGKLDKIDDITVLVVSVSFFGSKATPVMSRCSQIAVEDNTLIAGYIQDVKLLALFDVRREQRLQSMPVHETVYDTCPVYMSNATYLTALTETKCRIYKLTSTS